MECEHAVGLVSDRERLLILLVQSLPLVKPIRRHQAASLLPCLAKSGTCCNSLGFGIDCAEGCLSVLRPERNQSPSHDGQFPVSCLLAQAHYRLETLRGDIVGGCQVGVIELVK